MPSSSLDPLILDLVDWVSREPRTYAEVMDAWRTSCPRLTVWEDAIERGFLMRGPGASRTAEVSVTPEGHAFLRTNSRGAAAVRSPMLQTV